MNSILEQISIGKLCTVYQTFIDAIDIIDNSDLTEESKNHEKAKILDARKSALGPHFSFVPPWNRKLCKLSPPLHFQ